MESRLTHTNMDGGSIDSEQMDVTVSPVASARLAPAVITATEAGAFCMACFSPSTKLSESYVIRLISLNQ